MPGAASTRLRPHVPPAARDTDRIGMTADGLDRVHRPRRRPKTAQVHRPSRRRRTRARPHGPPPRWRAFRLPSVSRSGARRAEGRDVRIVAVTMPRRDLTDTTVRHRGPSGWTRATGVAGVKLGVVGLVPVAAGARARRAADRRPGRRRRRRSAKVNRLLTSARRVRCPTRCASWRPSATVAAGVRRRGNRHGRPHPLRQQQAAAVEAPRAARPRRAPTSATTPRPRPAPTPSPRSARCRRPPQVRRRRRRGRGHQPLQRRRLPARRASTAPCCASSCTPTSAASPTGAAATRRRPAPRRSPAAHRHSRAAIRACRCAPGRRRSSTAPTPARPRPSATYQVALTRSSSTRFGSSRAARSSCTRGQAATIMLTPPPAGSSTAPRWTPPTSTALRAAHRPRQRVIRDELVRARARRRGARQQPRPASTPCILHARPAARGVTIVMLVARALVRSLRVLRTAALDVAERRLPQAVAEHARRATAPDVTVDPVPLDTRDEVGQVARAFDAVHGQAIRLAADQAALQTERQRDVRQPLPAQPGARRAPAAAHRAARERTSRTPTSCRTCSSSTTSPPACGATARTCWSSRAPTSRSATSRRSRWSTCCAPRCRRSSSTSGSSCRPRRPPSIVGRAASDLVHLLAELLDNATNFSPPDSQVVMSTTRTAEGDILVEIADRGVGMIDYELADANQRLGGPSSVDVSASRRMGLFVVGRLGARHGVEVQLSTLGRRCAAPASPRRSPCPPQLVPASGAPRETVTASAARRGRSPPAPCRRRSRATATVAPSLSALVAGSDGTASGSLFAVPAANGVPTAAPARRCRPAARLHAEPGRPAAQPRRRSQAARIRPPPGPRSGSGPARATDVRRPAGRGPVAGTSRPRATERSRSSRRSSRPTPGRSVTRAPRPRPRAFGTSRRRSAGPRAHRASATAPAPQRAAHRLRAGQHRRRSRRPATGRPRPALLSPPSGPRASSERAPAAGPLPRRTPTTARRRRAVGMGRYAPGDRSRPPPEPTASTLAPPPSAAALERRRHAVPRRRAAATTTRRRSPSRRAMPDRSAAQAGDRTHAGRRPPAARHRASPSRRFGTGRPTGPTAPPSVAATVPRPGHPPLGPPLLPLTPVARAPPPPRCRRSAAPPTTPPEAQHAQQRPARRPGPAPGGTADAPAGHSARVRRRASPRVLSRPSRPRTRPASAGDGRASSTPPADAPEAAEAEAADIPAEQPAVEDRGRGRAGGRRPRADGPRGRRSGGDRGARSGRPHRRSGPTPRRRPPPGGARRGSTVRRSHPPRRSAMPISPLPQRIPSRPIARAARGGCTTRCRRTAAGRSDAERRRRLRTEASRHRRWSGAGRGRAAPGPRRGRQPSRRARRRPAACRHGPGEAEPRPAGGPLFAESLPAGRRSRPSRWRRRHPGSARPRRSSRRSPRRGSAPTGRCRSPGTPTAAGTRNGPGRWQAPAAEADAPPDARRHGRTGSCAPGSGGPRRRRRRPARPGPAVPAQPLQDQPPERPLSLGRRRVLQPRRRGVAGAPDRRPRRDRPDEVTAAGLPKRRPRARLVPGQCRIGGAGAARRRPRAARRTSAAGWQLPAGCPSGPREPVRPDRPTTVPRVAHAGRPSRRGDLVTAPPHPAEPVRMAGHELRRAGRPGSRTRSSCPPTVCCSPSSDRLPRDRADQLAAVASGLISLTQGAARCFDAGRGRADGRRDGPAASCC